MTMCIHTTTGESADQHISAHTLCSGMMNLCFSNLSGLVWVQWDGRCRCRTTADPPPCVAAGHFVVERAGASDRGCPTLARSACPWVERWRCECRRSRQRQCCHLDGLRSPLRGKHLWCFWGSLLPSCWLLRWMHTPVWTDNCFASSINYNMQTNHRGSVAVLFGWICSLIIILRNNELACAVIFPRLCLPTSSTS